MGSPDSPRVGRVSISRTVPQFVSAPARPRIGAPPPAPHLFQPRAQRPNPHALLAIVGQDRGFRKLSDHVANPRGRASGVRRGNSHSRGSRRGCVAQSCVARIGRLAFPAWTSGRRIVVSALRPSRAGFNEPHPAANNLVQHLAPTHRFGCAAGYVRIAGPDSTLQRLDRQKGSLPAVSLPAPLVRMPDGRTMLEALLLLLQCSKSGLGSGAAGHSA